MRQAAPIGYLSDNARPDLLPETGNVFRGQAIRGDRRQNMKTDSLGFSKLPALLW